MFLGFIFTFLLGLAVGSFLNVLIWRIPRNEPIGATRSYCPNCKKELRWYELVPIASFVWQGGKCRSCHTAISWQYPLVELATGLLFLFVAFYEGGLSLLGGTVPPLVVGYWLFIVSVLIVIFVTDLRYYIIPDKITFPAIGIALVYNLGTCLWTENCLSVEALAKVEDFLPFVLHPISGPVIAGLFTSLFFLSLVLASKGRWMGLGDVKFAFLMGLVLGFPNIFVALFLAFTLGSFVGILLMGLGKRTLQSHLPLGTFLAFGTFVALFWGNQIFNWYWNVIL